MFCGDSEAVVTLQKTLGHRSGTALPVWTHAPDSLSAGHWLLSEAIPSDCCPHHGVLPWGHHLKCSHLLGGRRYGSQVSHSREALQGFPVSAWESRARLCFKKNLATSGCSEGKYCKHHLSQLQVHSAAGSFCFFPTAFSILSDGWDLVHVQQ